MVNIAGCSDVVLMFAYLGGIVLYLLFGALVGVLVRAITNVEEYNGEDLSIFVMSMIFWPIVLVAIVLYAIGMWLLTPIWAATKTDLRNTERRLSNRINERCSNSITSSVNRDIRFINNSFRVGDIITGSVPQTDNQGKNISYKHLYQGCKCRVLSIDRNGSMRVILLDHKDKSAHSSAIGETFTAPARNFVLANKENKKRKAVKSNRAKR